MKNPIEWAKKIVVNLGAKRAHTICCTTGAELIGQQKDTLNPHFMFYRIARRYIEKTHPEALK